MWLRGSIEKNLIDYNYKAGLVMEVENTLKNTSYKRKNSSHRIDEIELAKKTTQGSKVY